jgi:membrane-bound lytic murein transglycosylase
MKTYALIAPLVLGTAVLASAQTTAPSRPATLDDVVSEIRAMRTDLQKMQEASLRAQLLVARLQVEEQRIAGMARDLAQTESEMRAVEAARNPFVDKMLQDLSKEPADGEDGEFAAMLKGQLEKLQNGDPALKERQASLSQRLAEEQARWTAFNAQLEALERELPVVKKR